LLAEQSESAQSIAPSQSSSMPSVQPPLSSSQPISRPFPKFFPGVRAEL
jgi:hypothetical protein